MKKVVIILCSILLFGFNYPNNDDTPIIAHFEKILNEYRYSNGLGKVVIDESIKEFADKRSKSLVQDFSHNGFKKNIYSQKFSFKFAGENIALVRNIPANGKPYYSSDIQEIGNIMNKMAIGTATNYDVALYCFLKWKHSKSHNELLLNHKIKRFYLSYDKSRTLYYFCLIALD